MRSRRRSKSRERQVAVPYLRDVVVALAAYEALTSSAMVLRADPSGVIVCYEAEAFDRLAALLSHLEDLGDELSAGECDGGADLEPSLGGLEPVLTSAGLDQRAWSAGATDGREVDVGDEGGADADHADCGLAPFDGHDQTAIDRGAHIRGYHP